MKSFNLVKNYRGLPKSIYILFFASIVNNCGNFVMMFLSLFLIYNVGLKASVVGTIVSINSVLGILGSLIGGKLIDTKGRKFTFVIFRSISALSVLSCAFIKEPYIVTGLLMVATFVSGFSSPVYSTMITDLTDGEERKLAFSLEYMAINIGCSVGPLIAAFLYNNYLKLMFIGDALTTFVSIIMIGLFVPETLGLRKKADINKDKIENDRNESLWSAFIKRKALVMFSFIVALYFIVFSQFNFGLPLQVGEVFKGSKTTIFGILLTINAVMCSFFTPIIVNATKNIGASLSIAIGGIFYTIGFGMMFYISSFPMFILSTVIWTIGEMLVSNNINVYIAKHTPDTHRGRFNSIFPIIRKVGFAVGPLMAGRVIKYSNIRSLWLIVGVLALVGATMMYRLYIFDKHEEENDMAQGLKEGI